MMYVPDSHLVQDEDEDGTPGRYNHAEGKRSRRASQSRRDSQGELDMFFQRRPQNSHVLITTTKVCTQELPLPDGVEVRVTFIYPHPLFPFSSLLSMILHIHIHCKVEYAQTTKYKGNNIIVIIIRR